MRNSNLKPPLTLQHILNIHLEELIDKGSFNTYQARILRALKQCKTGSLGEHWEVCDNCGVVKVHYNSCGNRHCPGCQGANRERWLLEREHDLFDVYYHHLTFTVPFELRPWFRMNEKLLYDVLFKSMKETLVLFSQNKQGRLKAEIGIISILHTWTQKLEYHPHLHCIVPSGGLTAAGKWKAKSSRFLFYVMSLSNEYKKIFCDQLKVLFQDDQLKFKEPISTHDFNRFMITLRKKKWVVNSKPGFNGKQSVLDYLGRYTHKIAISNYRLISLKKGIVTFSYRDRKAGDVVKEMSLPVEQFLLRFSQHILPKGYIKIRHYGLFASRVKAEKLALVRKALKQEQPAKKEKLTLAEVILKTTGVDITLCPICKEGKMLIFKVIHPARGSPRKLLNVKLETNV